MEGRTRCRRDPAPPREPAGAHLGARPAARGALGYASAEVDYVLVQIAGDRIAAEPEPDTAGAFQSYVEADVVPGRARYIARGGAETAINVGLERYREILIELK